MPASVEVRPVPENLPRLGPDFEPPVLRDVCVTTTVVMQTVDVDAVRIEWRLANGEGTDVTVIGEGEAWTFELPATLQPVAIQRAHLTGEGPEQATPWFTLQSENPSWTVDENAYLPAILCDGAGVHGRLLCHSSGAHRQKQTN